MLHCRGADRPNWLIFLKTRPGKAHALWGGMRHLKTCLAVVATLAALPAFATGERIFIASQGVAADQLKETLCLSMECAASKDGVEVTVTAKAAHDAIELKVVGADGAVRLTQRVPALDDGRFSSTDLVSSTSKIFKAIESPQLMAEQQAHEKAEAARAKLDAKQAKAKAKALASAKLKKKNGLRLAAR
jgi:hypothetical protein